MLLTEGPFYCASDGRATPGAGKAGVLRTITGRCMVRAMEPSEQSFDDRSVPAGLGESPSARLRRTLVGRGHQLKARLTVGRAGLTDAFIRQVREVLAHADLVKVRIDCDDRDEAAGMAAELARRVPCHLVQRVGRVALLYRPLPDDEDEEAPSEDAGS